ncbi:MAG: hypothetical protein JO016_16350 [Actinobacteria bacterium]|nr:hypothetical protein [Actinomycetota bacterium]
MSEIDFLEAIGNAAAEDAPSDEVAQIIKEAAVAVERSRLARAFNDYNRIQQVKNSLGQTD